VIDRLLALLAHQDPRVACGVAIRFQSALQRPIGLFNLAIPEEVQKAWRSEFRGTLTELNRVLDRTPLAPIVLYTLAQAVVWLAQHETGEVADLANRVVERLKKDSRGRVISTLISPYQHVFRPMEESPSLDGLKQTAQEVLHLRSGSDELFTFLASCLEDIQNSPHKAHGASDLLWALFEANPSLAQVYLSGFPTSIPPKLWPFAHLALASLLYTESPSALKAVRAGLAKPEGPLGLPVIAKAYTSGPFGPLAERLREPVLRVIVRAESEEVFRLGYPVAHKMAQQDPELAREILADTKFDAHPDRVDDYLMGLCNSPIGPASRLSIDQIRKVLNGLLPLQDLHSHWVQDFLGQSLRRDPELTMAFIRQRLEQSIDRGWQYTPVPYGPFLQTSLSLLNLPGGISLLEDFLQWSQTLRAQEKPRAHLPHVIQALSVARGEILVDVLSKLVDRGSPDALDLASMILGSVEGNLIFENPDLVSRLMSTAMQFGSDLQNKIFHSLVRSAVSGVRQGSLGQPFPRDLDLQRRAEDSIGALSADDPGVPVYQAILEHALAAISRAEKEGELMREEDGA